MTQTILIGLDGADFQIMEPLMGDGVMPFLKSLVDEGVTAELMSTPNPFTPPAWTTVMTGRTPGNHGVFDFAHVVRPDGIPRSKMATSRDVRCETIWSIASRHGRRVNTLNFPLMYPPRPLAGNSVPGFVRWRHLRHSVYPPVLYETLCELPGFNRKELALDWDLERKALQALPHGEYEDWIRFHLRREQQWMGIVRHLAKNDPADLLAVLFDGVDKLQHLCWRFLSPALASSATTDWEQKIRRLCLEYFRQLDGFLAEIVDLGGDDARIVIVSDHGFQATRDIFYVNSWLEKEGYLQWADGIEVRQDDQLNVEGHADPASLFDWQNTRACALTAGSMGIYVRQASEPGQHGVPADEYEGFCRSLADSLSEFRSPESGRPVVSDVLLRGEAFPGMFSFQAPDLTLILSNGGSMSVTRSDALVKPRDEVSGIHRPEGIFISHGPGIRRGQRIGALEIADTAPTVLHSLGLPIPEDLEGDVAVEAFEPEFLRDQPVRSGDPTHPPQPFPVQAEDPKVEAQEEALIAERLKALGYL